MSEAGGDLRVNETIVCQVGCVESASHSVSIMGDVVLGQQLMHEKARLWNGALMGCLRAGLYERHGLVKYESLSIGPRSLTTVLASCPHLDLVGGSRGG